MRVMYLHGLSGDAGVIAKAGEVREVSDDEGRRLVAAGVASWLPSVEPESDGEGDDETGGEKRAPETPEGRGKRKKETR